MMAPNRGFSNSRKRSPDLILVQHDNGKNDIGENIGKQPLNSIQSIKSGNPIKQQEHYEAERHLNAPSAAHEQQKAINDESNQCDVDEIADGESGDLEVSQHRLHFVDSLP
jgi:hypothetical protein